MCNFALALRHEAHTYKQHGALVQLVRIHACHAWGHGFESRTHRKKSSKKLELFLFIGISRKFAKLVLCKIKSDGIACAGHRIYCIGNINGYLLRIFFPFLMTMPLVSSFTLTPSMLYVALSVVSADVSATLDRLVVAVAILYSPYFDSW